MKTYNKLLIPRARTMRFAMSPTEKVLWLKVLRPCSYKFRRQRPFGRFIVDFYCPAKQLVIEVDGKEHFHADGLAYDAKRTAILESYNLRVIRFTNDEVMNSLNMVKEVIYKCLE